MGETGSDTGPWAEQTVGQRIVTAAWRAVAAHLAAAVERPPADPSLPPPHVRPAGHDRLR